MPIQFSDHDLADLDHLSRGLTREQKAQLLVWADQRECVSLRTYVERAWHVLEPAKFVGSWHIDCMCEHLEAVTRLQIRNLLINIPPRCSKSLVISVFWMTWVWSQQPASRWLYNSYGQDLSTRDSLKCRTLILSPWYQARWGNKFVLSGDQNLKTRFQNNKTGYRLATSVGGGNTGEGGDYIVADDPNNVKEAESDLVREGTNVWWSESMSTRFNDLKTVRRVVVQQRTHARDVSGFVLEQKDYVHLCLPMEFEVERKCVVEITGWRDPRQVEGESICEERFGPTEIADLKKQLRSAYAIAGQLQQRPAPRGGGLIRLAWFQRYKVMPRRWTRITQSWDTANKAKESNAPWVCSTWMECDEYDYLLDVHRERYEYPEGKRQVYAQARKWEPDVVLIEDKSSGTSLIQDIRANNRERALANREERSLLAPALVVIPMEPDADKVTRMSTESSEIEAGHVWLPEEAVWLAEYENELQLFPNGQFADQTDSTSQYLKWRRQRRQKFVAEKPVYTSFSRAAHVALVPFNFAEKGNEEQKPFDPERWMWRSWHVGSRVGVHACVWGQIVDRRLYVFGARQQAGAFGEEVLDYENGEIHVQGIGAFIDELKLLHHELYPRARWQDIGTEDIFRPPGRIGQEVPWQMFTNNGISPQQATTTDPTVLITYCDAWLEAMVNGEAAFQVAPDARVIIDAMAGGYHWKAEKGGKPADGPFNSVMLALQVMCSRLPTKPFMQSSRPELLTLPQPVVNDLGLSGKRAMGERWDQW